MKVCIVGGVAGGAAAAARLRRLDEQARIIMFEQGDYISFANCGLPYHLSGKIKERRSLFLQTPERFWERFRVEVRINSEVASIDCREKRLRVRNLQTREEYEESYDTLILSPGARPFVPPVEGADAGVLLHLQNIADMDAIMTRIQESSVKAVVVIGGGFIGLEIVENLIALGITVHLVEMLGQVLAPFDPEMASLLHAQLLGKGVHLHLSDRVQQIEGGGPWSVVLASGKALPAGLVIAAVGVRPECRLAEGAGLKIGTTGGIAVDEHMRTSDPHIFAVGDAVETACFVSGRPVLIPLAGPASKQARIAADNICGVSSGYRGTQGTSVVKVFDLQAAATGMNEKTLRKNNIACHAIHLHAQNHAGYYPGAVQLSMKLLFDTRDGKILGAQCIGTEGADKRIDVIATAIRARMTVYDLEELELAYAPPFGAAKDPVNMAGFIGGNILRGLVESVTWDQVGALDNPLILDVRTVDEFQVGAIPQSVNVPLDELRQRQQELPKERLIVVVCRTGVRSYAALRTLKQSGFGRLSNLSGGYVSYCHYTASPYEPLPPMPNPPPLIAGQAPK